MKRAGDVLSAIFDEGMMEKAKTYSALFSCWQDLMEKNGIPAAADHSRVKTIDRGIVWAEVDHPGWKQILQSKESKLLSDFRYRFPKMGISGFSISLCKPGALRQNPDGDPANRPAVETAVTEKHLPERVAAPDAADVQTGSGYEAIKDEAFKETLMRLEKRIAEKNAER